MYKCIYVYMHICIYYICIYGVASKFGYGSARGDPNVWNGLDYLRFGMDRGFTFRFAAIYNI